MNAFHPGTVKSDLGRNFPFPLSLAFALAQPVLPEESACGVYVSTSEALNGVTGQLFLGMKPRPLAFEPAYRNRLWAATETLVANVLHWLLHVEDVLEVAIISPEKLGARPSARKTR